jgi:hypothetical protein
MTDLTLPASGIPIIFARVYRSRSTMSTSLGYGWNHTYGMYLRPNLDGSLTSDFLISGEFGLALYMSE